MLAGALFAVVFGIQALPVPEHRRNPRSEAYQRLARPIVSVSVAVTVVAGATWLVATIVG